MLRSLFKSVASSFVNNYKNLHGYIIRWGSLDEDGYRTIRFVSSGIVYEFKIIPEKNILHGKTYSLYDYNDKKIKHVETKEIVIYNNNYLRLINSVYNKNTNDFKVTLDEKTDEVRVISEFIDDFKKEHEMADSIIIGNCIEYFYHEKSKTHCLGYNLEDEIWMDLIISMSNSLGISKQYNLVYRQDARKYNENYNIVLLSKDKESLNGGRQSFKSLIEGTVR